MTVGLAHSLVQLPEWVRAVLPDGRHAGHELLVAHPRLDQWFSILGYDVTLQQGQIRFDDGDVGDHRRFTVAEEHYEALTFV